MKIFRTLARIGIALSLAASCGKSPSKNEDDKKPTPSSSNQEGYKPLKEVEKTAYSFTLNNGKSSCEEFKRRLEGKTWGFNLEVAKSKNITQVEEARFFVNEALCQPGEDTLTFLATSAESMGFSVSFNMKFSDAEGVLNYQLDDCYTTAISRLIDRMPVSNKPTTATDTHKVRKSINDNYCVPAVDKLSELIVNDLRLVSDYSDPKLVDQLRTQELGDTTEADFLRAIPLITTRGEEIQWDSKVRDFIRAYPERSDAFIPLLEEAPIDGVAMRVIATALGRIGHREAQKTLRQVIDLRLGKSKSVAALFPLLVQSSTPTPETVQYVRSQINSDDSLTGSSALLAYGQLAATTRRVAPAISAEILAELKRMLGSEEHPDRQRTLIFAAANSESQELLEDLALLADRTADPRVKEHAIQAMGDLQGAGVAE